jgi:glutaredoxin 3
MATRLLEKKGVEFEKIQVDEKPELRNEMTSRSGGTTVPQIFIGDQHVGGYMELAELDMQGNLDDLLEA